jgi:hypothetical protein
MGVNGAPIDTQTQPMLKNWLSVPSEHEESSLLPEDAEFQDAKEFESSSESDDLRHGGWRFGMPPAIRAIYPSLSPPGASTPPSIEVAIASLQPQVNIPLMGNMEKRGTDRFGVTQFWQIRHLIPTSNWLTKPKRARTSPSI